MIHKMQQGKTLLCLFTWKQITSWNNLNQCMLTFVFFFVCICLFVCFVFIYFFLPVSFVLIAPNVGRSAETVTSERTKKVIKTIVEERNIMMKGGGRKWKRKKKKKESWQERKEKWKDLIRGGRKRKKVVGTK